MWMLWLALAAGQVGQPEVKPAEDTSGLQEPVGGWPKPGPVVKGLMAEAEKLEPLVKTAVAKRFLSRAASLVEPRAAAVYRNREKGAALTAEEWEKLPEAERAGYVKREYPAEFYYSTGYGSPLVYARVVDIMAGLGVGGGAEDAGSAAAFPRVMDFGYGSIGQLRMMAEMSWTAVGVDVDPVLGAVYRAYAPGHMARKENGATVVCTGRWPAEDAVVKEVGRCAPYDVITSKNTLKRGYIHPEPPEGKKADERQLVKLGVDDAAFLKAVHGALKPGGLFIIYNIFPVQSPETDLTKPYLPMADGRSPFTREQFGAAGFDVVEFDRDDQAWVLDCWKALGYDGGKAREEAAKETFALYTVVRRK